MAHVSGQHDTHSDQGALASADEHPRTVAEARMHAAAVAHAPDASRALAAVVGELLANKSLQAVLEELAGADVDLSAVHLAADAVPITWDAGVAARWPPNPPPFVFRPGRRPPPRVGWQSGITAAELLATMRDHRAHLDETIATMLDEVGPNRFIVLSGSAMAARFPDYVARMAYDTDVMARSLDDAAAIIDAGCRLGGQLAYLQLNEDGGGRGAVVWARDGHMVTFGFEVARSHGLDPWERSETVPWQGRRLRVPSPEDLLLLLAAKHRMGRVFGYADRADVETIVAGSAFDLSYLAAAARRHGLATPLGRLLEATLTGTAPNPPPRSGVRHPVRVIESALRRYRREMLAHDGATAMSRGVRWVDDRFGQRMGLPIAGTLRRTVHPARPLCALRTAPLDPIGCVRWQDPATPNGDIAEFVEALPASTGLIPHRCERFTIEHRLRSTDGQA